VTDILTITLNPAVDVATTTDQPVPAHRLRCTESHRFAGGGGIDVARVLHRRGYRTDLRRFVVPSGSLPPELSEDAFAQLARIAAACGIRVVLYTSGAAPGAALDSGCV